MNVTNDEDSINCRYEKEKYEKKKIPREHIKKNFYRS